MTSSIGYSRKYKSLIKKNLNGNNVSIYYHKTKEDVISVSNKTADARKVTTSGFVLGNLCTELTIFTLNPYANVFVPNGEIMYNPSNLGDDVTLVSPSIPNKEISDLTDIFEYG